MSDPGHHHDGHSSPPGHDHGDHDHGPPIWRLNRWLYPLVHRNPPSNSLLVDLAGLQSDDRVLDIGCGPGVAVRAAAARVGVSVGADPSVRMLTIARRRSKTLPNVRYVQAPAHHLPFGDGAFTVAWTIHSMHHWGDRIAGLMEARRVLAPGGRLYVVEVLDPGRPWGVDEAGVKRIAEMLRQTGFTGVGWGIHRVGRVDEAVMVGRADDGERGH